MLKHLSISDIDCKYNWVSHAQTISSKLIIQCTLLQKSEHNQ